MDPLQYPGKGVSRAALAHEATEAARLLLERLESGEHDPDVLREMFLELGLWINLLTVKRGNR